MAVLPVWVFDVERLRFAWGNASALSLWRAASTDELVERDCSDTSESAQTRLRGYLEAVRGGGSSHDEWTLYPRGVPVTGRLYYSAVPLDDGRSALLFQGVYHDDGPDPELTRGIEALRHTSAMVALVSSSGEVLMQNPASLRAFGALTALADWFVDPETAAEVALTAGEGRVFQSERTARTLQGERWHEVEARRATDPVTGAPAILVHQIDETARRSAERDAEAKGRLVEDLHRALSVVEAQRAQILSLSAPVLEVARDVLAVPMIGSLSAGRSAEIAERLMRTVVARRARSVILDLTGADLLDNEGIGHMLRMVQAVRLLGARAVLTGIRPALAGALAQGGVDLSGVVVLRSLRRGIAACMGELERAFAVSGRGERAR